MNIKKNFIKYILMKKYFNKDAYTFRVKGQHLIDSEKPNRGWRKYTRGQPISLSKFLRIYIQKKDHYVIHKKNYGEMR